MLDQTCRLVVGKGSIGANVMALFKGEYDEIYLQESYYTPWDLYPVFCLVKSAGYRFDYKTADMLSFKEFEPIVNGEVQKIDAHKKIILLTALQYELRRT